MWQLKKRNGAVRTYIHSEYTLIIDMQAVHGFIISDDNAFPFLSNVQLASLLHVLDLPPLNF
jgi:hypothetical protein